MDAAEPPLMSEREFKILTEQIKERHEKALEAFYQASLDLAVRLTGFIADNYKPFLRVKPEVEMSVFVYREADPRYYAEGVSISLPLIEVRSNWSLYKSHVWELTIADRSMQSPMPDSYDKNIVDDGFPTAGACLCSPWEHTEKLEVLVTGEHRELPVQELYAKMTKRIIDAADFPLKRIRGVCHEAAALA